MRNRLVTAILGLTVVSCASVSPTDDSVRSASRRVAGAMENAHVSCYSRPVRLRTRLGPCECDSALEFEVHLFGQWRHVLVTGDAGVRALRAEAEKQGTGGIFDFYFDFVRDIYVSGHGQKFYILRPVVTN